MLKRERIARAWTHYESRLHTGWPFKEVGGNPGGSTVMIVLLGVKWISSFAYDLGCSREPVLGG